MRLDVETGMASKTEEVNQGGDQTMSDIYEKARKKRVEIEGAVDPAHAEAKNSGLPGEHNGPGDAYRHMIGAAEITRRFGEATARVVLEGHEIQGNLSGDPKEESVMDRHNNEIGIGIGREAKSLDEVNERVRGNIEPIRPIPAGRGGPVHVRIHDRACGVAVCAYERSRPG
jgi:hypothetical protein